MYKELVSKFTAALPDDYVDLGRIINPVILRDVKKYAGFLGRNLKNLLQSDSNTPEHTQALNSLGVCIDADENIVGGVVWSSFDHKNNTWNLQLLFDVGDQQPVIKADLQVDVVGGHVRYKAFVDFPVELGVEQLKGNKDDSIDWEKYFMSMCSLSAVDETFYTLSAVSGKQEDSDTADVLVRTGIILTIADTIQELACEWRIGVKVNAVTNAIETDTEERVHPVHMQSTASMLNLSAAIASMVKMVNADNIAEEDEDDEFDDDFDQESSEEQDEFDDGDGEGFGLEEMSVPNKILH
jgi:hypothetical protein